MAVIRMILFVLSTIGTWEILRHRVRFHESFLPSLTVALQVFLLLAAGLLHGLLGMAAALEAAGLTGLAYYTFREKGRNLKTWLKIEYLFLLLGMAGLCLCVRGRIFTHYDNFSHWALVVKKMLRMDRFPDPGMTGITYWAYPLGSTVYVYFAGRLTGGGETLWMLAQGYVMLTCLMPLFQLCRGNRWIGLVLALFAGNFLLSYNVQVTELLVDTLLPLTGMCALLFVHANRDQPAKAAPAVFLYLVWILQIKNSAAFFGLLVALVYLYYAGKQHRFGTGAVCAAAGFASMPLWNWHCAVTYPAAEASKHSLSSSWWQEALGEKTVEDVKYIILEVTRFAVRWKALWFCVLLLALIGAGCLLIRKDRRRAFGKAAALILGMYAAWQIGLQLMYILSMTRMEALQLTSLIRYEKTIVIAMVYLLTALGMSLLREEPLRRPVSAGLALLMSASLLGLSWNSEDTSRGVYDYRPYRIGIYNGLEVRNWMEKLKAKNDLPEKGDYAILIEDWDSDYFYFLGMYLFPDSNIDVFEQSGPESLKWISRAQYLLNHDRENPVMREWLHREYPEQEKNDLVLLR